MKTARTKRALRDADGPFWIHRRQAPKPLFPFQFWSDFSLISLLALWNNKNWPHSIKMKHIKNCQYKMGLKGCKWSTLNVPNVPGTQTPLSQSVLELDFSLISSLWGNKNWPPSIEIKQIENGQNKMGLKGCKCSSLNAPGTQTLLSHSVLWGIKKWPSTIKVKQIVWSIPGVSWHFDDIDCIMTAAPQAGKGWHFRHA